MPRRVFVSVIVFLAWTLFVWIGRVRNALTDVDLTGSDRVGPLVLSASFVLPAVALAVLLLLRSRAGRPVDGALRGGVAALAAWTTGVWLVRSIDIAFVGEQGLEIGGGHEAAFVAVHMVLAAVSVLLAAVAVNSLRPRAGVDESRTDRPRTGATTSR